MKGSLKRPVHSFNKQSYANAHKVLGTGWCGKKINQVNSENIFLRYYTANLSLTVFSSGD